MQIESLKVFCDLAETQSFTRAAQINSVTQSAVSQQISSLERVFNSLLIERSKKRFRLTREGQVLYDYSKQLIQTFDSLQSKLQEIKDIVSGRSGSRRFTVSGCTTCALSEEVLEELPDRQCPRRVPPANQVYDDVMATWSIWAWSPIPCAIASWNCIHSAKSRWC